MMYLKVSLKNLLFIAIPCLFLFSCQPDDDKVKRISLDNYTEDDQLQFGDNLYQGLLGYPEEFQILSESEYPDLYDYLNSLYFTLSNTNLVSKREKFNWKVTVVLDDQKKLAFTAPGGRIYIYSGLLKYLSGEHELASIISHEIYYTETGLNIELLQEEFASDPFLLGDIYLGNDVPAVLEVIEKFNKVSYHQDDVEKADEFGILNICPFAYNSKGLHEFIERANQDANPVAWTEVRPIYSNRINTVKELALPCSNIEEDPTFSQRYMENIAKLP